MRRDLRKLFWRLRTELIRRAVLEEAVEEACDRLVSDRFRQDHPLHAESRFVCSFVADFEDRIAHARLWLQAGEHLRAVRAVEAAETALAKAWEAVRAEEELRGVRAVWEDLASRYELVALARLPTVRVAERSLAVAETFLAEAEARKARLVTEQLRLDLDRLSRPEPDESRRSSLIRLLVAVREEGGEAAEILAAAAGRLVDAGLLELTQRLVEDWSILDPEGEDRRDAEADHGPARSRRPRLSASLTRFAEIEREAERLIRVLAECADSGMATTAQPAVAGLMARTETETE